MKRPAHATPGIPWQRGVAWLLFLGPFFFLSYGFANSMAARWQVGTAVVYDWERHIPFLPWTILPYWSIDLFYGLSFLLCRSALQVECAHRERDDIETAPLREFGEAQLKALVQQELKKSATP